MVAYYAFRVVLGEIVEVLKDVVVIGVGDGYDTGEVRRAGRR